MSRVLLTALNYSAGVQSEWMLWMILLGILQRAKNLAVFNADPGMENSDSYRFAAAMRSRCEELQIDFITANGPSLLDDLVSLKKSGKSRLDNPPFWTPSRTGKKVGRLTQKCTQFYKISPMDREVRLWLNNRYAIGIKQGAWLGVGTVEKWIGFTADEQDRADGLVASKHQKYVRFRFPLIEAGMTKTDVVAEYIKHDIPIPPPSLCNACPYSGLRRLKKMHDERPDDWLQAVAVDEVCRDLRQIGVDESCYVSSTLIPLQQLADMDFKLDDPMKNDLHQCSSGVCFT